MFDRTQERYLSLTILAERALRIINTTEQSIPNDWYEQYQDAFKAVFLCLCNDADQRRDFVDSLMYKLAADEALRMQRLQSVTVPLLKRYFQRHILELISDLNSRTPPLTDSSDDEQESNNDYQF